MEKTEKQIDNRRVRVLLVEDDRDDYLLTREMFDEMSGHRYVLDWVAEYDEGLAAICRGEHDVYLLDYRLGARDGIDLLREAVEQNCTGPAIILTGQGEREIDVAAMQAGAADYLDKGRLNAPLLERSIRYAMQHKRLKDELEKRVEERTEELQKANESLRKEVADRISADEALRASSEFSKTIFESSPDCVKILDAQGGLLQMNANGLCVMEIDDFAPLKGLPWFELWPDDAREDVKASLDDARNKGAGNFQRFCPTAKGMPKWWDVSIAPVRDAYGEVMNFVSVSRDITDRREARRVLEESEARKTAMFETALDCIISIDHSGTITEFNGAAELTLGHRREDVIGRELAEIIIPPPYRDRHRDGMAHFLATGEGPILNQRLELSALRSDGTEFPVELAVTQIPVEGPPQFTAYLRDITARKLLEAMQETSTNKLRQLAADLSEADRRKNEFLAMLAHELRNPLAPIRNALQIMRLTEGDAATTAASEMMERQVGQLVRLVDDLLDVSRITRGKIELRTGRIELASSVNHAVEAARPAYEASGVELTVTMPQQPIYLEGDPTRLAQVVGNLLNNACKFTDKGGRIQLVVEREDAYSLIRVTDSGIGIAPEQIPYIFDMFVQADTSLERATSGLGIGLTLVKSLVEMHGGTVEAHSGGLGLGSEFVVRLPVLIESAESASTPEPAIGAKASVPKRILVVDDNVDSAESLAMLLQLTGHDVRMANDGLEAVEVAAAFVPEVILLDIGLPKLNGYEAAREIRMQPWGENMTLIALTGWGQEEDRQRSKDAGFNGHMVKPVDHIELMKRLDELA